MVMSILSISITFIAGIILGLFYFGGLWITVRQLPTTIYPVRLFIVSFLGRIVVTMFGFYLIMDGQWQRILIGLGGFTLARIILTNFGKTELSNSNFKL